MRHVSAVQADPSITRPLARGPVFPLPLDGESKIGYGCLFRLNWPRDDRCSRLTNMIKTREVLACQGGPFKD